MPGCRGSPLLSEGTQRLEGVASLAVEESHARDPGIHDVRADDEGQKRQPTSDGASLVAQRQRLQALRSMGIPLTTRLPVCYVLGNTGATDNLGGPRP